MKETPIIMSGNHPKLILDGIKTQTRRVCKEIISTSQNGRPHNPMIKRGGIWLLPTEWSPYGQVGDRLWVRETWQVVSFSLMAGDPKGLKVAYKADDSTKIFKVSFEDWHKYSSMGYDKWRPSIHMHRWASRITLEITEVRVERVQEIDYFGARAEGILSFNGEHPDPTNGGMGYNRGKEGLPMRYDSTAAFMDLWDSLNAKKYPWSSNPWVWCISFRRVA